MTADDIAKRLKLQKSQVNTWLRHAVSDGKVTRLTTRSRTPTTNFSFSNSS